MPNPYIRDEPAPNPGPPVGPVQSLTGQPMAIATLLLALAGLFLPMDGCKFDSLPIPVPPFVEPVVDPAETEGAWVVVVEETNDRTPEIAAVLSDVPFWDTVAERGLRWRVYDIDAEESSPYRKIATDVGIPAVLVLSAKSDPPGKVLGKFKLPVGDDAKATLDAKIKEVTGR